MWLFCIHKYVNDSLFHPCFVLFYKLIFWKNQDENLLQDIPHPSLGQKERAFGQEFSCSFKEENLTDLHQQNDERAKCFIHTRDILSRNLSTLL